MGEMIQRVARAICDAEAHESGSIGHRSCVSEGALCRQGAIGAKCDAFKMARAAIEAMRDPTEAMKRVYISSSQPDGEGNYDPDEDDKAEFWRNAIDAALSEYGATEETP